MCDCYYCVDCVHYSFCSSPFRCDVFPQFCESCSIAGKASKCYDSQESDWVAWCSEEKNNEYR